MTACHREQNRIGAVCVAVWCPDSGFEPEAELVDSWRYLPQDRFDADTLGVI